VPLRRRVPNAACRGFRREPMQPPFGEERVEAVCTRAGSQARKGWRIVGSPGTETFAVFDFLFEQTLSLTLSISVLLGVVRALG
jgi:hypothetical protein